MTCEEDVLSPLLVSLWFISFKVGKDCICASLYKNNVFSMFQISSRWNQKLEKKLVTGSQHRDAWDKEPRTTQHPIKHYQFEPWLLHFCFSSLLKCLRNST